MTDSAASGAYDLTVDGHDVHVEAFGMGRDFHSRYQNRNRDEIGGGLGRYGTAQLPDITVGANGQARPLSEVMLLAGGTLHARPALDFYAYAGMEQDARSSQGTVGGVNYGYGNPLNSNAGCDIEGSTATCTGDNLLGRRTTAGAWDTFYNGAFGRLRGGLRYSFTQRFAFSAVQGGGPHADESAVLTSIRYYPF